MSAMDQKRTCLFFLSVPLLFLHFRYALVVLGDTTHDVFGFIVLEAFTDAEHFFCAEAPVLRVFEIGSHMRRD